jgi:hypothetical protein
MTHGRLIFTALTLIAAAPLALSQPATTSPTSRPAATRRASTQPIDAARTLSRMLRPTTPVAKPLQPLPSDRPVVDTTSGKYALPPGAPDAKLVREGTYIVDRIGRLRRTDDGQHEEFVFDSDGAAMQDPPMIILTNLTLMQMENASAAARDRKFRVTGQVTEYRGRNCVLLDKAVPVADEIRVNP